jgi:hypothetical protein
MINYFKHLRKNSFTVSLRTTLLPSKVQLWAKLNGGGNKWLILKYSFPTSTLFKSKITCKGLTFAPVVSTGGGDLKPPKASYGPFSSLTISWRTRGGFSYMAPSNPTKGDYNHNGIDGPSEGRNIGALLIEDVKPHRNDGWTGDGVSLFHLSYHLTCHLQCNSVPSNCPSIWTVVLWFAPGPK